MPLISANNLAHYYGEQLCFREATFAIHQGQRIGLIGANGTGKTTLLRVLLGQLEYEGDLARQKNLRLAFLEQDPAFPPGQTVRTAMLSAATEVRDLEAEIAARHAQLGPPGLDDARAAQLLDELATLEHRFEAARGYELEHRASGILEGLGFSKDRYAQPVETLSGGERNRLALARLLLLEPDLWLLDEPTNHLDFDGLAFLEGLLKGSRAAAVLVSHDRHFLDEVTSETWELEAGRLFTYPAPYTRSKALREERIRAQQRAFEKQQEYIAREQEFIRRYKAGQRAKEARGRDKRLQRLEKIAEPFVQERVMNLHLPVYESPGTRALEARTLAFGYDGKRLVSGLDLELLPGETLGVAGPNGAGKTTLLRVLLGELEPLQGEIRWGQKARLGVLRQLEDFPASDDTPLTYLRRAMPDATFQQVRDTLGAMLFTGDTVEKPVGILSGGERKRLMLTRLLLEGRNLLLLDEPTNHLDIPSREALELALTAYEGTVVVVSHDRYFLDLIADRVLWMEDGAWKLTHGGFAEARAAREARRAAAREAARPAERKPDAWAPKPKAPKAPRPHLRLTTEELETRIVAAERRIKELEWLFNAPDLYAQHRKYREVETALVALRAELAALEAEYFSRKE